VKPSGDGIIDLIVGDMRWEGLVAWATTRVAAAGNGRHGWCRDRRRLQVVVEAARPAAVEWHSAVVGKKERRTIESVRSAKT
jgi:hypothetical protein